MDLPQELFGIALRCKSVSGTLEDYEFLAALLAYLLPNEDKNSFRDSIFDKRNEKPADIAMLCLASQKCDNVWTARDGIDWLLFYLFYRRYGWDDGGNPQSRIQVFSPSILERTRWTTREGELKFKERIVTVSTDLINWYESQPLKLFTLKLFNSAIRVARCSPMTRHHMALHAIRWLTLQLESASSTQTTSMVTRSSVVNNSPFLPADATPETMYLAVKDLVLLSMTNSVYATRTAVIPLMSRLLLQLSLCSITRLLDQVIEMFNRQEVKRWEEAEGLLNALGLLIKRAVPLPSSSDEALSNLTLNSTIGPATTMSPETYETQVLPQIKLLVFNLFDHDHPSVRIGAVHLYITCLKRCPYPLIEKALDEIMNEVCINKESDSPIPMEDLGPSLSTHATESLLSLCQSLLKRAGGVKLPPSTGRLQNNLTQTYLGHTDPNVRMAACQVYETLIVSALENLNRVRYLLKKILENWPIRQDILLSPVQRTITLINGGKGKAPSQVMVPDQVATWREGRLMIFERVCHVLIQRHYAVLFNVLVRNPDGDLFSEDTANIDGQRLYSPVTLPVRSPTGQPKRSPQLEPASSADYRWNPVTDEPAPPSLTRRLSAFPSLENFSVQSKHGGQTRFRGFGGRKNTEALESILDRLRKSDEQEKAKRSEAPRTSVWRSEFAKRFSVVALRQPSTKTESLGALSEVEMSNMTTIFSHILYLSSECLISEPRELRQCGRTTLSETIRLLRWYNTDMVSEFLTNNLILQPTLMTYVALKILRSSLDEFVLYDRLVFCNEDFAPMDVNGCNYPDSRNKHGQVVDLFPNGYFLNVPLIRALFNVSQSASWLRACQHYLTDESIPTFVTLPAFRCIVATLSLAHLLPKFNQAARYTESLKPSSGGEKSEPILLGIDAASLVEAIRAVTGYIRRFEIVLDDCCRPSTILGEHLRIRSLRPFNLRFNEIGSPKTSPSSRNDILIPFLSYVINHLEVVLFRFLPPTPNPSKPDPLTRKNAGFMLAPMLNQLITWPLALLPAGTVDPPTISSAGREKKLLAVRKLLRVIASIVHALPVMEANTPKSLHKAEDISSLSVQVEGVISGQLDLTGTVNAYFTRLEGMMADLTRAWAPTPLCQSASWWWFRALCEHMPRMLQIAPHANPVSLIRRLLDATGKLSRGGKPAKQAVRLLSDRRLVQLWSKALAYAKMEARKELASKKKGQSLGYRWPTVGELLKSVESSRTDSTGSERRSSNEKKRSDFSDENDSVFESPFDMAQVMNYKNPAFDYMTDEEENFVLEPAEPDSSSSEELEMTERKQTRARMSLSRKNRRRRLTSNSEPKAQPIETPPPFYDIVDLVKRAWRYCQPVTVGTLRNILSSAELSLIIEENDPTKALSSQYPQHQPQRRMSYGRIVRLS
ncbi:hypothetical protein CRM22_001194 [Opisthorchis felineus]|uniref:Uncharacterized protein n=1 Tax=Opisthorchis felineus TaxID=147828 RepID=A0A4S2MBN6_OPIFE|nr:hypothetical protein CRM22_001194 [Opisthorchis felineus]